MSSPYVTTLPLSCSAAALTCGTQVSFRRVGSGAVWQLGSGRVTDGAIGKVMEAFGVGWKSMVPGGANPPPDRMVTEGRVKPGLGA